MLSTCAGSTAGSMIRVYISTGQPQVLWHATVPARGSPVLGGGALWVVDYQAGLLDLLDPGTGAVLQKLSIGPAPHFAS